MVKLLCGLVAGMFCMWGYFFFFHTYTKPAYYIKKEYATTKVTTKLSEIKKCKFEKAEEWWAQDGYEAVIYLGPLDWHQSQIPKKMSMIFTDLDENWSVQVNDQKPESDRSPSHVYYGNKPSNEFLLELDNPDAAYAWRIVLYPKVKDADPNFSPDNVRVHFDWKIERRK